MKYLLFLIILGASAWFAYQYKWFDPSKVQEIQLPGITSLNDAPEPPQAVTSTSDWIILEDIQNRSLEVKLYVKTPTTIFFIRKSDQQVFELSLSKLSSKSLQQIQSFSYQLTENEKDKLLEYAFKASLKTIPIEVIGADWCPRCVEAKAFFKQYNIPVQYYDLDVSSAAKELDKQWGGGSGIPAIKVNGQVKRGFSEKNMKNYLAFRYLELRQTPIH